MLVLAAMVLAACGGEQTDVPGTDLPPVTAEATEDMSTATESPTEEMTSTPGVPVTGEENPARISNQLDFSVWSQDGEQIGEVDDMVLDLDNTRVAYVVVGTGGFLDLGEREILVPWDSLQLQTGTGDTTGGQPNAFILQTDVDTFSNAPDFDLGANLPEMGQPADDWDLDIRNFWEGGGTTTTNTPAADGTALPEATATGSVSGAGTDQATATSETGTGQATATAGTGTGTDTGEATALQGVVLASDVLGSAITFGTGTGTGTGTDLATATADPGTGLATATADTGTGGTGTGQATATAGTGTGGTGQATATADTGTGGTGTGTDTSSMSGTIEDLITDIDSGDILYIVISTTLADGERWNPVPLSMFQLDSGNQAFVLNIDATMLQDAPFFSDGEFPDATTEFDTFWQNNGAGAGGATATATP